MKTASWALAAIALLAGGRTWSEALPVGSPSDSRIRTAIFNPGEVYRLYAHVGYALELIFEEGESGAGQAGGDLDAITLAWHDNRLILKPRAPRVGTNLIIYTNRRAYRFEYSVRIPAHAGP